MKYLLILLLFINIATYGQITVTGQLVDIADNPIGLATIDVVGKNLSASTDDLGLFYLKLSSEVKKGDIVTLRISKDRYKTATKQIAVSSLSIPIRLIRNKTSSSLISKSNSAVPRKSEGNSPVIPDVHVTSYF